MQMQMWYINESKKKVQSRDQSESQGHESLEGTMFSFNLSLQLAGLAKSVVSVG